MRIKSFFYIFLICITSLFACNNSSSIDNKNTIDKVSPYSRESLNNSRIGVLSGTAHDSYVTENFKDAKIFRFDNISDLIENLKNNKIDYGINDTPAVQELIRKESIFFIDDSKFLKFDISIFFSKENAKTQQEFNVFLSDFKHTKEYRALKERWHTNVNLKNIPIVELPKTGPILRFAVSSSVSFPNVTIVDNKFTGFEIELVKHFAKAKGYRLEIKDYNALGVIGALSTCKADLAAGSINVTDERKKRFLYSEPHSYTYVSVFSMCKNEYKDNVIPVVKSLKPGQPTTIEDTIRTLIEGKRVALLEGSAQEKYLTDLFPNRKFLVFKEFSDASQSILVNKSDLALISKIEALTYIKQNPSFQIILDNFGFNQIGFGISKNNPQLKEELDIFLKEFDTNNRLEKLNQKWYDQLDKGKIEGINLKNNHSKTLVVGTSGLTPPYTFISEGKNEGLDIEIISHFCDSAGYNLKIVQMPFGALIAALASDKIDVIANSLLQTKERESKINFTTSYSRQNFSFIADRERLNTEVEEEGGFWVTLKESFNNNIIKEDRYKLILDGLYLTIIIAFFSIILGTIIGMLICFMNMHSSAILRSLARSYITIIRGTPVLVLLMINFYVVFASVDINASVIAIISFAMNFGAYVSEMFRSSIISIDKGQREAGLAMGFTSIGTFIFIIAPQAIKRVMPVYKGESISLVKMTSIVGYIAVQDITKVSDIIRSRTFDAFFPLLVSALLYFLIAYLFSKLLDILSSKIIK